MVSLNSLYIIPPPSPFDFSTQVADGGRSVPGIQGSDHLLPALLTVPSVCEQHVAAAAAEAKQQRLVYEDAEVCASCDHVAK